MLVETMTALGLIAGSFSATNVDNLALLVSWLLANRGRRPQILAGHLLGMFVLMLIAFAFGLGANFVPIQYVGYLGVIPIGLGLKGLYDCFRDQGGTQAGSAGAGAGVGPLAIAATQIANGVDTVLVLGPLLADSELGVDLVMVTGFVAMVLVWFGLARLFERHAAQLSIVQRYIHWIAPIVLILVGLYILDNTATDLLPGD